MNGAPRTDSWNPCQIPDAAPKYPRAVVIQDHRRPVAIESGQNWRGGGGRWSRNNSVHDRQLRDAGRDILDDSRPWTNSPDFPGRLNRREVDRGGTGSKLGRGSVYYKPERGFSEADVQSSSRLFSLLFFFSLQRARFTELTARFLRLRGRCYVLTEADSSAAMVLWIPRCSSSSFGGENVFGRWKNSRSVSFAGAGIFMGLFGEFGR